MVEAIITALDMVPIPIFCLRGIHKIKILMLIKNVARPTLIFNLKANPSANTVQGVTPNVETINNASPNPNNVKPKNK